MRRWMLALLVVALSVPCMQAKAPKPVKGVILALNAEEGTLQVQVGQSSKAQVQSLSLARPDLPVTDAIGKPMKLTELKVGHVVNLDVSMSTEDVVAIQTLPTRQSVVVVRVDLDNRRMELRKGKETQVYTISHEVRVEHQQRPIPIQEIKAGMRLSVSYLLEKNEIVSIRRNSSSQPQ